MIKEMLYCDRCKKKANDLHILGRMIPLTMFLLIITEPDTYYVCKNCKKSFKEWFKGDKMKCEFCDEYFDYKNGFKKVYNVEKKKKQKLCMKCYNEVVLHERVQNINIEQERK